MKKKFLRTALAASIVTLIVGCDSNSMSDNPSVQQDPHAKRASELVAGMTTKEKLAQKIILSFRYDCTDEQSMTGVTCTNPLTEINPSISKIINEHKIGGVILFANNAQNPDQTAKLIWDMQNAVEDNQEVGLFMTVDQEGGNVVRLPRATSTNFVGNMGLGAVYESGNNPEVAYDVGTILATEVKALGFNVNFAPNVDVQSNSLNPVINVRSFGESPEKVGLLGGKVAQAMAAQGVIATFKHFPGHGDTLTDSHFGMPIVDRPREDIERIELLPYKTAIDNGYAPDMVMTAHIQFPTLDDTVFTSTKTGDVMNTPATLSRTIQHDILRGQLGYKGVTITDALDMEAIKAFFTNLESTSLVFESGVDIALMPILVHAPREVADFETLLDDLVGRVESGHINEDELNESVERILTLKLKRGILNENGSTSLTEVQAKAKTTIGTEKSKTFEKQLAKEAVTLLQDRNGILPLDAASLGNIYIATPLQHQADGFVQAFKENNILNAVGTTFLPKDWNATKIMIDAADSVIIGTQSTAPTPVDLNGDLTQTILPNSGDALYARAIAEYAKAQGKQVITVALRAPYDAVNYDDVSDVSLAVFNFFGYENGVWIGESIRAGVNAILGNAPITGKLPVNVYDFKDNKLGDVVYPIGYGIELQPK